jgi:hypothetical protein
MNPISILRELQRSKSRASQKRANQSSIEKLAKRADKIKGTDRVGRAIGMLDGEASCLVDEREDGVALLILDVHAKANILHPVLVLVAGVGGGEDEGAVTDGEAGPLISLAEDLEGGRRALRIPAEVAEHLSQIFSWRGFAGPGAVYM